MAIRVGCGSWGDPEYVGLLYPPGLPPAQRLHEYATWFDHVEVNSSYYATPRRAVVENWVRQTPPDFLFDLKLHRNLLSSMAKASPVKAVSEKGKKTKKALPAKAKPEPDLLAYTLEQVQPLIDAGKLGAFLLLLPPYFGPEKKRLEELDALVERIRPHRLAVEFRNNAWVAEERRAETLAYFRSRGLTWVSVDMPKLDHPSLMPPLQEVTQPALAYLRLHGRNPAYLEAESAEERHTYLYGARELKELASQIRRLAEQASEVRVVANNHAQDFAPRTAIRRPSAVPEVSSVLSAPAPWVSVRMAATASSVFGLIKPSAPNSLARASRSALTSSAMTRAPMAAASCVAESPTGPWPTTAIVSPPARFIRRSA